MVKVSRKRVPKARAVHLLVEEPRWREEAVVLRLVRRAVRLTLAACLEGNGQSVTILLSNNAKLRALNRHFRNKDKPTNVLSFESADDPASLGDIALGFGTVASEARAQRKSLAEHAAHLAMHGTLHLLGYDHEKSSDAERMETLETELLARLGIADPYAPRPYTKRRKAS